MHYAFMCLTPGDIYIRRLGPFLGVKIMNFRYFGDFQKNQNIGGGYEDFYPHILGIITKLGCFGGHFMVLFKVNVQNENIFLGMLMFQMSFWG